MDLDLVIAVNLMVVSAVALIISGLYRPSGWQGWAAVHALVVSVGCAAITWAPGYATIAASAVFVPFFLLPLGLAHLAQRANFAGRSTLAVRLDEMSLWLHPSAASRLRRQLATALTLPTSAATETALAALATATPAALRPHVDAYIGVERDDWAAVLAATRAPPAPPYELKALEIRALGELGRLDEMVVLYDRVKTRLYGQLSEAQLFVLAFTGRAEGVDALLEGPLAHLPREARMYWRAIAARARDPDHPLARTVLQQIADGARRTRSRRAAARHLARNDLAHLTLVSATIVDAVIARRVREASVSSRPWSRLVATPFLMAVNCLMFAWAEWQGGSDDVRVLYDLGALWVPAIERGGEWWRLITASILHLGPVHLAANMFMLAVLGRAIESRYGWARTLVLFIWCGIGSMGLVYLAMRHGIIEDGLLVGASGAILGLLGALTADVLVTWLQTRDTLDRSRLSMLALILLLQATVDFSIPNVSFAAHASGFVLGVAAGVLLSVIGARRAK